MGGYGTNRTLASLVGGLALAAGLPADGNSRSALVELALAADATAARFVVAERNAVAWVRAKGSDQVYLVSLTGHFEHSCPAFTPPRACSTRHLTLALDAATGRSHDSAYTQYAFPLSLYGDPERIDLP